MKVSDNLIFSDQLHKREEKICKRMQQGKRIPGLYCIALPSHSDNLMDIYSYNELLQPPMKGLNIHVVGLAGSKEDAVFMVVQMLEKTYHATGGFDVVSHYELDQQE